MITPKTCQDFCNLLDTLRLSNCQAGLRLGLNEKTIGRYVNAPAEAPLPRWLGLAMVGLQKESTG